MQLTIPTRKTRHRRSRVSRLATVIMLVFSNLFFFAFSASAHHPNVSASVDCDGEITLTAVTWVYGTNNGLHEKVDVYLQPNNGPEYKVGTGKFTDANGRQFTLTGDPAGPGTYIAALKVTDPNAYPMNIRVHANGKWGPPGARNHGGGESRTLTNSDVPQGKLNLPTNCNTSNPAATPASSFNCDTGVNWSLQNTGDVALDFVTTITVGDVVTQLDNGKLEVGKTASGAYGLLEEDESGVIKITWSHNGSQVGSYTSDPHVADCFQAAPGGTPASSFSCETGGAWSFDNTGNVDLDVLVTVGGETAFDGTVATGTDIDGTFTIEEDGTKAVVITWSYNGEQLGTHAPDAYSGDCFQAAPGGTPASSFSCETGGAWSFDNTGNVDLDVLVTVGGETAFDGTVATGTDIDGTFTIEEDGTKAVVITWSYNGDLLGTHAPDAYSGDCFQAAPAGTANASFSCEQGGAWTFDNTGNVPLDVVVTINGGTVFSGSVASGASDDFSIVEDGTAKVVITWSYAGDVVDSYESDTFDGNCIRPSAQAGSSFSCAEGGFWSIDNTGNVALDVVVTVDGVERFNDSVSSSATGTFTIPEDDTAVVVITWSYDGEVIGSDTSDTFDGDCYSATATSDHSCANGGFWSFENTGELAMFVHVTIDGATTTVGPIAGGDDTSSSFFLDEDASSNVVIAWSATQDGARTTVHTSDVYDANCYDQDVDATHSCQNGGVLTIENTGQLGASFVVNFDGSPVDEIFVEAGETVTIPVPVTEDDSTLVEVFTYDADEELVQVLSEELSRNCEGTPPSQPPTNDPAADASHSCQDGGVIELDNSDSDEDVDFTVTIDGDSEVITVEAGEIETITFTVDEDSSTTVTVEADDETLVDDTFTKDCDEASVGFTTVCDPDGTGGALVTLDNSDNGVDTVFAVTKDGELVDTVLVEAGEVEEFFVPTEEDTPAVITVSTGDGEAETFEVTIDCVDVQGVDIERPDNPSPDPDPAPEPPVVGGEDIERPQADPELPQTGVSTGGLALLAFAQLLVGAILLLPKRPRIEASTLV